MTIKRQKLLFGTRCTNHQHRPTLWDPEPPRRRSQQTSRRSSDPIIRAWERTAELCPGIVVDPKIAGGVPCLDGSGVPVHSILSAIEFHGSISSVLALFPSVSEAQIKNAVRFAQCLAGGREDFSAMGDSVPAWMAGSPFWNAKSIEQLIAEQGTRAVTDFSLLSGAIPDEDVDEFVADIYRQRG